MRSRLFNETTVVVATVMGTMCLSAPSMAGEGDTAWTTGLGADGQLGNGSTANRSTYGSVIDLSGVDDISGGREHVIALRNGEVFTWGDGSKGATGIGRITDTVEPTAVTGLPAVTKVVAGHYHSLALLADGTVRAWGFNALGQLGDGTTFRRTSPVSVRGLANVVDIAAGRDMSYAILADGTMKAWEAALTASWATGR